MTTLRTQMSMNPRMLFNALTVSVVLQIIVPVLAASQSASEPAMSNEARAYLTTALDSLQAASMRRATTDWEAVRDSAFLLATGAQRLDQTYGAINWALRRVDRHSFLQVQWPWVNRELIAGRFGYFRVPTHMVNSTLALADTLQDALREMEAGGACGWIVDLRMNGGGNAWPMNAGIGPLLGDSIINMKVENGRPGARAVYVEGAAIDVAANGERTVIASVMNPYRMRERNAPVAVLIDGGTASSGEAIAIAFRPRPNTHFFGQPTAGYTTANRGVRLPDGANMVVTFDAMSDRTGRIYADPLQPDELVEMPDGYGPPSSRDAVARRAAEWLARQPACSVASR